MLKLTRIINVNKLNYDALNLLDDDIVTLDFSSNKKLSFAFDFEKSKLKDLFNSLIINRKVLATFTDISITSLKDFVDEFNVHGVILKGTYTKDFLYFLKDNFESFTKIILVDDKSVVLDNFLKIYSDCLDYFIVDNFDKNRSLLEIREYLNQVLLIDNDGSYETYASENNFKGLVI